jgi:hypothetical protein
VTGCFSSLFAFTSATVFFVGFLKTNLKKVAVVAFVLYLKL